MQKTPVSNRHHIAIFGTTNAGKSALVNALSGSAVSLVSSVSGTTTDPVTKAVELLGFGPIVYVDTAGLNDRSRLGKKRVERSHKVLERSNFVLYLLNGAALAGEAVAEEKAYQEFKKLLENRNIPHLLLMSKADLVTETERKLWMAKYPELVFVSSEDPGSIKTLRKLLIEKLQQTQIDEAGLLDGILTYGDTIVLVVPIDSEAPKGRLILPQVQTIRAALDMGVRCILTSEVQLAEVLNELPKVDLVITDSQAFHVLTEIVPDTTPLTSFSILMARQKGQFPELVAAARSIAELKDGDKILIAEACSHNTSHEDIGSVKIPTALRKQTNKALTFDFVTGRDFPSDLSSYALIVHCGSCMISATEFKNRFLYANNQGVPMTNYGTVLAYTSGMLERSVEALKLE